MEDKNEDKGNEGAKDTGDGVQPETTTELDRADAIVERQGRENTRREKILDREEAMAARKAVGGGIEAGQVKEEKKDESDHDYRVRIDKELKEGKTEFGD